MIANGPQPMTLARPCYRAVTGARADDGDSGLRVEVGVQASERMAEIEAVAATRATRAR